MRCRTYGMGSLLLTAATLLTRDAQACSVCLGGSEGQGLSGGYYWSALLLTLLPFAVIAVIGAWVRRTLGRAPERTLSEAGDPVAVEKR